MRWSSRRPRREERANTAGYQRRAPPRKSAARPGASPGGPLSADVGCWPCRVPPAEHTSSRPRSSSGHGRRGPRWCRSSSATRRAGRGPRSPSRAARRRCASALEGPASPVYVHAPYIINVASTNNRIRIPSRKLLQQFVDAAAEIGAAGLVVHGGNVAPARGRRSRKGYDNWRKAVEATDLKFPVLIENTAGGDRSVARTLERIERSGRPSPPPRARDRSASASTPATPTRPASSWRPPSSGCGRSPGRIDLVHLNDSRDAFGSGADRHASSGRARPTPTAWRPWSARPACPPSWRHPAVRPSAAPTSPGSRARL